jgi:Na+-transporting methylmalonyl-CoA/oxaloacetate decarboxylase gamma subunit
MQLVKAILTLIYQVIMAFPKFFAPFLGAIPYLGTILAFLPQLVELVRGIAAAVDRGATKIEMQKRVEAVAKAFENPDRVKAAKELKDAITFK